MDFEGINEASYKKQYLDYEVVDGLHGLSYHKPMNEREQTAMKRCRPYLFTIHALNWAAWIFVVLCTLWSHFHDVRYGANQLTTEKVVMILVLVSAVLMAYTVVCFVMPKYSVAELMILNQWDFMEWDQRRAYGFFFLIAVQEETRSIYKNIKIFRSEYDKSIYGKSLLVFRSGFRYVGIVCNPPETDW